MNYWDSRAAERLGRSEQIGKAGQKALMDIYENAENEINQRISNLLGDYLEGGKIEIDTLNGFLTSEEYMKHSRTVNELLTKISPGLNIKKFSKTDINELTRLNALKQQIYYTITAEVDKEEAIHERTYEQILRTSYSDNLQDIQQQTGFLTSFSQIDNETVRSILTERWKGANWSERVWNNNQKLARELPIILGERFLTGASIDKASRVVRERFNVRRFEATRLVRTETNYMFGRAEQQSYEDEGIQKYIYSAVLDGRTSDICEELNGQVFLVREQEVGVNMHPMHPNCRSTTKVYIPEEMTVKELKKEGGKEMRLNPADGIEDLEERWGLPHIADSAKVGQGRGTYIAKINQGGDKALNAESEWIMATWNQLGKTKKQLAWQRLGTIIEQMEDQGQKTQVEFVKKMLDF